MNQTEPEPERSILINRAITATRLLFTGALVAVFVLLALPTQASELWKIDGFSTNIEVGDTGVLYIEEEIEADFLQPRHGIFRYIPYKGLTTDGEKYNIAIRLIGVIDQDGVEQHVNQSRSNGNIVWKIGDADRTFTGNKTYHIAYEVRGGILRFDDRDELFWNIAGEGWDVALPALKATVQYRETDQSAIEIQCFTGPYGSKAEECFALKAPSFSGFTTDNEGDPMTISVSWPKGFIGEESFFILLAVFLAKYWHFSIPLLTFLFYQAAWKEYGDDDTEYSVIPEYEAPKELRPAQVIALLRQGSSAKSLAPTIIDLAVRGYLTISETSSKVLFLTTKDYLLKKTEKDALGLQVFEKDLIFNLFGSQNEIKTSDLKNTFYKHIPDFTGRIVDSLVEKKLFDAHPLKTRAKWIIPGLALLIFTFFAVLIVSSRMFWVAAPGIFLLIALYLLRKHYIKKGVVKSPKNFMVILVVLLHLFLTFGNLSGALLGSHIDILFFVSFVVTAFIIMIFGWAMPKWTHEGAASVKHAKGFKMFISKVKKHRTAWEENENIFEEVLPYALAFGLGAKWASVFSDLNNRPPEWYRGSVPGNWNPVAFETSLSSMTKSFTTAVTSSPRSSGGSSGGFSGGGGGGGGGGSW